MALSESRTAAPDGGLDAAPERWVGTPPSPVQLLTDYGLGQHGGGRHVAGHVVGPSLPLHRRPRPLPGVPRARPLGGRYTVVAGWWGRSISPARDVAAPWAEGHSDGVWPVVHAARGLGGLPRRRRSAWVRADLRRTSSVRRPRLQGRCSARLRRASTQRFERPTGTHESRRRPPQPRAPIRLRHPGRLVGNPVSSGNRPALDRSRRRRRRGRCAGRPGLLGHRASRSFRPTSPRPGNTLDELPQRAALVEELLADVRWRRAEALDLAIVERPRRLAGPGGQA